MNPVLTRAIAAIIVMGTVSAIASGRYLRTGGRGLLLIAIGAASLAMLGVTHVCEALHIFPVMRWGIYGGPGHYLNLASLSAGLILLSVGYWVSRRASRGTDGGQTD